MLPVNPYLAERLAQERTQQALRAAEQARLAREARGRPARAAWSWAWTALAGLAAALALWLIR